MQNYLIGDIAKCHHMWTQITDDPWVLDIVQNGMSLDFCKAPICYNVNPSTTQNAQKRAVIASEIRSLVRKGVIQPTKLTAGAYVSTVFTTEKSDDTHRMILNLKKLNEHISYVHFKMESLQNVLQLMKPGVWMGSIDLKDAYYSVRVMESHQRFFTFYWDMAYYEYVRMPNGYAQAPLIFTKLLKQPFSFLRKQGYASVIYIDDSYLQGDT